MTGVSVKPNERVTLSCDIFGYPTSTITWSFTPCANHYLFDGLYRSCIDNKRIIFGVTHISFYFNLLSLINRIIQLFFVRPQSKEFETEQKTVFNQTSKVTFTPDSSGFVTCEASNSEGAAEIKANVIYDFVEILGNIHLFDFNQTEKLYFSILLPYFQMFHTSDRALLL